MEKSIRQVVHNRPAKTEVQALMDRAKASPVCDRAPRAAVLDFLLPGMMCYQGEVEAKYGLPAGVLGDDLYGFLKKSLMVPAK